MVNIRKATKNDIVQFKEVIKSSILFLCRDYYTLDQLRALLGQFPEHTLYEKWLNERVMVVAENNQGIIGFAQYNTDLKFIEAVHVAPQQARQGIGKRLLGELELIAAGKGALKITLESSLNATQFYDKCGYKKVKHGKYYCKNGVVLETVTYEKSLENRGQPGTTP